MARPCVAVQYSGKSILVLRSGLQKVYILSAGWGIVGADFFTPAVSLLRTSRHGTLGARSPPSRFFVFPSASEVLIL